ncbi:hypothetical protein KY290_022326 [Solanum tuberosum]|uniref:Uncharacterized protein n=1 Tax=Solanum tuberosum TaxID=4113 RepID=A0ABQ7V531_SOLTU|nr:hypothetical protein KY289_021448 [Solanum tuberosum]KAH0758833.1 hypothetical protein KY290_022326 [Solanum tuberosum]
MEVLGGFKWCLLAGKGRSNGCVCSLVWGHLVVAFCLKKKKMNGVWVAGDWPEFGVVELSNYS